MTVATQLPEPLHWLLVVDQFEEVFTLCSDRALQSTFIQTLTSVIQQEVPRLAIVTTMRADFVEPWLAFGELTKAIQSQAVFLGAMTREGLEAAIVHPAKRLNYRVQARLLAEMLRDVETEANSLPLLQFALQQVWEQRDKEQRELTFAAYQQLGGVAGALNQKAEAIYHRLEAVGQGDWVRRVLLKLVRTGEATKDTRQRRLKTELLEIGTDATTRQTIEVVITALVDGRLLVSDRVNHQDVIDLSHEALIQRWQQLAKWRERDRDVRRLVDKIEDAQREWLKQGRKRQDLLQGRLLKDARQLLKQQAEAITGTKVFIQKSLYWRRIQLATTLLVPALILGIPAEYFWREESVKRDYDRIEQLSDASQGEREAVLNLAGGCWAANDYKWVPTYFQERMFGNCKSLMSIKLEKADLRNLDLRGVNLIRANLSGADLKDANLSGANFTEANLSATDFRYANLRNADLTLTNLTNATLGNADLSGTTFSGGVGRDAYIGGGHMLASFQATDLSGVSLSLVNLSGADLRGVILRNANLRWANLDNADLSAADLDAADFTRTSLRGTNLKGANFACSEGINALEKRTRLCTNLEDIEWDKNTQWQGTTGWEQVENIPLALKQQLGLR